MSFFLDTDILSLFAKADAIDLLLRLCHVERLAITGILAWFKSADFTFTDGIV